MTSTEGQILAQLAASEGLTRSQLAVLLDSPNPTITSAVRRLLTEGVVVEQAEPVAGGTAGRPARLLRLAGPARLFGLLSWRGDTVTATCSTMDGSVVGAAVTSVPRPVRSADDLDEAVDAVRVVAGRQPEGQLDAIVISVPAPLLNPRSDLSVADRDRSPSASFAVVATSALAEELSVRHQRRVLVENNANLAALGEFRSGLRDRPDSMIYVKIDQRGLGGAVITHDQVLRGAHGYAGELAHVQLDRDGPLCICGGRGCLRTKIASLIADSAQAAYQRTVTIADLVEFATDADPGATRILRDIGRTVGIALAPLCTVVDPDCIVIDDTLGSAVSHLRDGVRASLESRTPPAIATAVRVLTGTLGADAERLGAPHLIRQAMAVDA